MKPESLGHYRILEKLGEGGMGVVYKALDTHLDRPVAIKVLPPGKVADPERKRRFVQEAKSASALNHPNIVTIYDINSDHGADYIAMEYIAGRTLDQVIPRQGIRLPEVLRIAIQIADGLAKAHGAGITHRDLKPSNVMVDNDGRAKILDFGLAKLTDRTEVSEQDATLTQSGHTAEGAIVGTVSYMSPEQAEGKKIDARSDIFSFGAVLYEMATGHRAFHGDTPVSTLAAVIHKDPKPLSELAPVMPRDLEKIITRCLRKERDRRFQGMPDVKVALEELREESESGKLNAPAPAKKGLPGWVLPAAAAVAVLGFGAHLAYRRYPAGPSETKITQLTRDSGYTAQPALSPDGKLVAYVSDRSGEGHADIWIQQMAGGQPVRLTRHPANESSPVFSPDGTTVYFSSTRDGGGIYAIPALGGDERIVFKERVRWALSPDGAWIAFNRFGAVGVDTPLFLVASTGGTPRQLETGLRRAVVEGWSSDGKSILIFGATTPSGPAAGDATRDATLQFVPIETGTPIPILSEEGKPISSGRWRWTGDRLLRASSGAVAAIDEFRTSNGRRLEGPPRRLVSYPGVSLSFDVSASGLIVLASLRSTEDIWSLPIDPSRAEVKGPPLKLTNDEAGEWNPTLSADGSRMVFSSDRSGNRDLWLRDMTTGKETQVTATPEAEIRGRISPDGAKVFYEVQGRVISMYVRELAGGQPRHVCDQCARPAWAPDSELVNYHSGDPIRAYSFRLSTGQRTELLSHPKLGIHSLEFSRDGQWVSFHTPLGPGKGNQAYVAPVRGGKVEPEAKWIAITGAERVSSPFWSTDGGRLYMIGGHRYDELLTQLLDPKTKHPRGPRVKVWEAPAGQRWFGPARNGMSFGRQELIMTMEESKGNLWKLEYTP